MLEINRHYTPEEETLKALQRPDDKTLIKELDDFWKNPVIRKYSISSIDQICAQYFYDKYAIIDLDVYL